MVGEKRDKLRGEDGEERTCSNRRLYGLRKSKAPGKVYEEGGVEQVKARIDSPKVVTPSHE